MITVVVFSMMVNIGYLYAITYYYSVMDLDLLLNQNWYLSNALCQVLQKSFHNFLDDFVLLKT